MDAAARTPPAAGSQSIGGGLRAAFSSSSGALGSAPSAQAGTDGLAGGGALGKQPTPDLQPWTSTLLDPASSVRQVNQHTTVHEMN